VTDQHSGGGYRITADVLSDGDMKAQLIHDMMVSLTKWRKQINLLDRETLAIIDKLEEVISTNRKQWTTSDANLLNS
jgi:hypothetical protein